MSKPLVLLILDGWGHREAIDDNAIAQARTPVLDELYERCPHSLVDCSGPAVGLPEGQMGNSEVGHLTIGSGRIVYQDMVRIDHAIETGEFASCQAFQQALKQARGCLHIMGLLSTGGVHSHQQQIFAAVEMAAKRRPDLNIALHAFLDGRDTPPRSALPSLEKLQQLCDELKQHNPSRSISIASVVGRYYAMDRDRRYERTRQAWSMLVEGTTQYRADSAEEAVQAAYQRGESDEFVKPTVIGEAQCIQAENAVLFMNFRADRARQLSYALTQEQFDGFERSTQLQLEPQNFVTLTSYAEDLNCACAFAKQKLEQTLGECVADAGLKQLRIAETEKYAHVTFFFNGREEQPLPGETRVLIPSPDVATYDLQPAMSAPEMTTRLVAEIKAQKWGLVVCNFANGDMVGHTGVFNAAVKAVETVDHCIGRISEALQECGGECLITADHGNCEQMLNTDDNQPHTAHTCHLVPLIYLGQRKVSVKDGGTLQDIAPTILSLLGLRQPAPMSGKALLHPVN